MQNLLFNNATTYVPSTDSTKAQGYATFFYFWPTHNINPLMGTTKLLVNLCHHEIVHRCLI